MDTHLISIRLIVPVVFLFCISGMTSAQTKPEDWQPTVRDVTISYKDSTVKTQVLLQSEDIKTFNNLIYYWYGQNRINTNMGGYSGSLLHGEYTVYDKDRNLITKGYFNQGLKVGNWKYWSSKGILKLSMDFSDGLPDGDYYLYDQNGFQIEKKKYKSGILQEQSPGKIWIKSSGKEAGKLKTDTVVIDSIDKTQ
jgi:antitoxin component YwqK of YwqJK toxin-antitoxin module